MDDSVLLLSLSSQIHTLYLVFHCLPEREQGCLETRSFSEKSTFHAFILNKFKKNSLLLCTVQSVSSRQLGHESSVLAGYPSSLQSWPHDAELTLKRKQKKYYEFSSF